MPSFADLKAKAANVTSVGVEKFQNIRDRNTSVPLAKTNWDPYSGLLPPPPPPRSAVNTNPPPLPDLLPPPRRMAASASLSRSNSDSPSPPVLPSRASPSVAPPMFPSRSLSPSVAPRPQLFTKPTSQVVDAGPPPQIHKFSRPDMRNRQPSATSVRKELDWTNLSQQDKEVFFSWLDEFFSNYGVEEHTINKAASSHIDRDKSFPPLSYPSGTEYGSAALDLAHYFSPTTPWQDAWYSLGDHPLPPPMAGGNNHLAAMSSVTMGSRKTLNVGAIFSDLSMFWGSVEFLKTNPRDSRSTKRVAQYLPSPGPLSQKPLIEAHETYGDTIGLYAESFLDSGQPCGRGECWDLANEALKYFQDFDYIPKPVPSIERTHGHLIYEARASDRGRKMEGRWRGGDNRIRRGDIVEWRKVRIGLLGGFATLGDPDHTAIIIEDVVPRRSPADGELIGPADIGILTVVEQSQGKLPQRGEYDLKRLEEGEMWIYRPIGMLVYLGVADLITEPPVNHARLQGL